MMASGLPGLPGLLVIGGGIAGISAAIEAAETGNEVYLVEREPYLGGRVAGMNRYFPKLCSPQCGLEINFRRIRQNKALRVFTLAEVEKVEGRPGDFTVTVRLKPRYVNDHCTGCGECVQACPVDRHNLKNYGMDTTRAIYLPQEIAEPFRYTIDPGACEGTKCGRCVEACRYGAIDLEMAPSTLTLRVGRIVLATGWRPYDPAQISTLGFGHFPDIISNVMMERLAAAGGPTGGELRRPSDGQPAKRVAFVQCAGSRDINHLAYCSGVCCLASLKQATYVLERYPDALVHIFFIDIRTPGGFEAFYQRLQNEPRIKFVKGKVARVLQEPGGELMVEAEDLLAGRMLRIPVDLLVLATGMVPETGPSLPPGINIPRDPYGFALPAPGIWPVGVAKRPMDVQASVRDATGGVLKAVGGDG